MLDCTTPKYRELYARWLTDPGKLLDLGNMRPNDRVIDLCGGTGLVAREAVRRGAMLAIVVDLDPSRAFKDQPDDARLLPPIWGNAEDVDVLLDNHIDGLHDVVHQWDVLQGKATEPSCRAGCRCKRIRPGTFDLVVCRQAINYLDLEKVSYAVHKVLRPGGRFVFNTFGKPRWTARTYRHDGRRFFEAAGYLGDHVVHVQAGLGIGLDVTKFRWHKPEEIKAAMGRYFLVKEIVQKNSSYYLCTKASHIRPLL
jgi:SAM-dependent methyltransferase